MYLPLPLKDCPFNAHHMLKELATLLLAASWVVCESYWLHTQSRKADVALAASISSYPLTLLVTVALFVMTG